MASETADMEAPAVATSAATDEFVSASETSSQNTEESTKNSQDTDTKEAKQEEEPPVAKEQEDVEMKDVQEEVKKEEPASADKKEEDVETTEAKDETEEKEEKTASKDVGVTPAAEVKDSEAKTEDEEPTAESVKEAAVVEDTAADEKSADAGDVEMKADNETAQETKSESNGAVAGEEDTASKSAPYGTEPPKTAPEAEEGVASPAEKDAPTKDAKLGTDGSETRKLEHGGAEAKDLSKVLSPKRKESVQTSETSNGVNGAAEPAAKKQKVAAAEPKTPEKPTKTATETASPSVMLSRDDMAKMEEDSGRLKFHVITNDGTDEHMVQLTTLKNIFAKQLPKMPKEYIVRLVFDKNHRSMLLLKNGTHVIGGICYRPFEKNHFAEIAFCAINASDQVKGYGTRLMNHLKEYVKTKNITHFLTYADNYAIGYFKKQGFTKSVSMARPDWYGYIKDYDGGTLMECTIHTLINYLRITSMIHKQRKAIQEKIQERSHAQMVYPGLTNFAEGRLMDIYMVPGVKEAGWSQVTIRNNRIGTRDQGSLKSQLSLVLKSVFNHRSAWPFHEPVDTTVVVDYLDHIKEPIDLQLISKRIDSGVYLSKPALKADLVKMCDNCTTYNTPDTNYYKAAVDLREFIQSRIQA